MPTESLVSTPNQGLRRRRDVIAQRVGETAVLVHLTSNRIYELNATGARVWELLDQVTTLEHVVATLTREFDDPATSLADEVSHIMSDFVREGLVEDARDA